jgi:hypothetical protein
MLEGNQKTRERLDRVAALVDGYETPYGLELLSSVHWMVTQEGASSPEDVTAGLRVWDPRKRQFTAGQVEEAFVRLNEQSWTQRTLRV